MMIALLEFFGRIWQGSDDKKRISPPRRRTKKDGERVTGRSQLASPSRPLSPSLRQSLAVKIWVCQDHGFLLRSGWFLKL